MLSEATVTLEVSDHVAVIEVGRPPNNYFDRDVLAAVADLAESAVDDGARAVVLCSAGKHFCAGYEFVSTPTGTSAEDATRAAYAQGARLFGIAVPVVAAVQGGAIGGGMGLACAADLRIAAPSSRFQANFARLGFHAGFGLTASLSRIVGHQRATRLLCTAESVRGTTAVEIGLADRLAEEGAVRRVAVELAEEIAGNAPLAVRSMLQTMRGDLLSKVRLAMEHEISEQVRLWGTEDCATGILASRERRKPVFVGR